MRRTLLALAVSVGAAGAAFAQNELPPTRADRAPAAPTQSAPPDGGKVYEYPPNTGAILRPQDRTSYDVPSSNPQSKSTGSDASGGSTTDPSRKAPEQVGR